LALRRRASTAILTGATAADLAVAAGRLICRRETVTRGRIAGLALSTGDVGAEIDALAGVRVLQLPGRTVRRRALTVAGVQTELLGRWTLIAQALLLAANLVRAADRSILLPEAGVAGAGIRVALLPLRAGIVTDPLAAAFVVRATAFLAGRAAVARLFLGRFVGDDSPLRL